MALIKSRVSLRNDTTENWLAHSWVVLLKGEIGIEYTTTGEVKMKIGDGTTPWNDLSYFDNSDNSIIIDTNIFAYDANKLTLRGFDEAPTGSCLIKDPTGKAVWGELPSGGNGGLIDGAKFFGEQENLPIVDRILEIPYAQHTKPGAVKLSKEFTLNENMELEIDNMNISKLTQLPGQDLVLKCGDAILTEEQGD